MFRRDQYIGPILFLVYINDMPDVVTNSLIVMFADDAKCFKVIDSLIDCIVFQNDLDSLSVWSIRNELLFQPPKCHNLRISRKRNSFHRDYYLSGHELEIVAKERDLGVIVCKDTNWAEHLTAIASKANRMLGFLKRNCAGILDSKALKLLYLSLVRSHLSYCSQVWAPQSVVKDILLIESVQRRATRFICKNNELSYRERLQKLNLLSINYWLELLDLVFFFKCMHGLVKLNISNFVSFNQGRTRRSTAGVYLKTPRTRTSCFRDSYLNRIVNLWNSRPDIVKNCTTVSGFKNQLKKFYFSRLFRVFDADNIRSYKIVCPKCRRINPLNVCSC